MTTSAALNDYAERYDRLRKHLNSLYSELTYTLTSDGSHDHYDRVWRQIDDATVELLKLLNDQQDGAA